MSQYTKAVSKDVRRASMASMQRAQDLHKGEPPPPPPPRAPAPGGGRVPRALPRGMLGEEEPNAVAGRGRRGG